jgi:hypothetical protein
MKHAIVLVVFLQGPVALAAQEIREACLSPVPPDIDLPAELLRQYRQELSAEFEQYFRATSLYIACLDAERAAAFEEAQAMTKAYTEFLELATKDENR